MLSRRHFLAFSASLVAAPRLAFGQGSGDGSAKRILKFVPAADLSVLDPITASANITRDHAFLVFDTLYGSNAELEPSLQMLGAEDVSADGLKWTLTLRDGLKFHDGTPVRAEDCVTSIKRWWKRDLLGQSLAKVTADLSAPDDKTIVFTLSQPYPRLPATLGKTGANICAIMPARLAATDPNTPVTEIVGSGPFRFVAGERIPGSLVVYERFEDYVPQPNGVPSFTAGPKIAKFDRIEWHIIPDSATAISALTNGEVDWVAQPLLDLLPVVQGNPDITVARVDTFGMIGVMRPNFLMPPFDNPEIRKVVMRAIDQRTFMAAISGDTDLTHTPAGFFTPGTPMASDAGFDIIEAPKDYDKLKQELIDAGYKGERVVVMTPADFPTINAIATVGAALLTRLGMDVDLQTMDWGTVVQRREQGSAGCGRLERVLHLLAGSRQRRSHRPPAHSRHGRARLVRLADASQARSAAHRLDRGRRDGGEEGDRGGPATRLLRGGPLLPARAAPPAGGIPLRSPRHAEGLLHILGRQSRLIRRPVLRIGGEADRVPASSTLTGALREC